ncbi:helix-turn-helix domain-containing protein [Parasphingorhabdus sp.]|uniref:helix-turn-helix domain-containing protein n=1 Tax=Parasphingorhabdus sp. TaxID=2709688 RepID=UPI003BB0E146
MGQINSDDLSVSSQFLFQAFRTCQELGARKPVLLSALDITDSELRDPKARYDSEIVTRLCQATAHELGRSNILPDIGSGMVPTGFSDIGYSALFGDTVEDVMQAAAAALDWGTSRPMLRWERSGAICRLLGDPVSNGTNELIFIIFSILSHIGGVVTNGGLAPVKAAYFRNREPRICDELARTEHHPLNLPCFFNQSQTYLELHPQVVDRRNPLGNRMLTRVVQEKSAKRKIAAKEAAPLTNLSYDYLFHLLDKSGLSLDAAAETFGMAERTLRRKLVAEGASFRQILEQVRRDACQLYFLEGTRSLSEIATKLGYSELSAFTRAYTAWHGRSPSRDLAAHIALAA